MQHGDPVIHSAWTKASDRTLSRDIDDTATLHHEERHWEEEEEETLQWMRKRLCVRRLRSSCCSGRITHASPSTISRTPSAFRSGRNQPDLLGPCVLTTSRFVQPRATPLLDTICCSARSLHLSLLCEDWPAVRRRSKVVLTSVSFSDIAVDIKTAGE